ncbi:MAG: MFS transporter, partial [Spirochaetota bacterium]
MKKKWLVLISVALAFFLVNFDGSAIVILLPTIQTYFLAEFYQVQWITLAGLLSIVLTLAIAGRLGDAIGKKIVFIIGALTYLIGTVLVAIAPSVTTITIFRIIQGVGLATFLTLGTAIVTEVFEEKKRGLALGIYNLLGLIGILAGPILAGALLQSVSWKVVFWIAAGIAVMSFFLARIFLPGTKEKSKVMLDVKGAALLFVVLV